MIMHYLIHEFLSIAFSTHNTSRKFFILKSFENGLNPNFFHFFPFTINE
jgi:hypothetical protein